MVHALNESEDSVGHERGDEDIDSIMHVLCDDREADGDRAHEKQHPESTVLRCQEKQKQR